MGRLDWVKDLVRAEQQLEQSDMVDFDVGLDTKQVVQDETIRFLKDLKENFVDYASAFNQMKGVSVGNIKIYGIANTEADFMLFRNGLKLIFSVRQPGLVSVRFNLGGFYPGTTTPEAVGTTEREDFLEAQWGAFNEIFWAYKKVKVGSVDHMVRYYLSQFIRESAR